NTDQHLLVHVHRDHRDLRPFPTRRSSDLRFYETDQGEIRVDGENIKDYSRSAIRSQTAFVLQDPYLFEATIRENIRYGRLTATDDEVVEAAKTANAHDFRSEEHTSEL